MSIQSLVIFVSMHKKTLISFIGLDFLVQIWSLLVKEKEQEQDGDICNDRLQNRNVQKKQCLTLR